MFFNSKERKIIKRYQELGGLLRDGVMMNPHKEARARQYIEKNEGAKQSHRKYILVHKIVIPVTVTVLAGVILALVLRK